MNVIKPNQTRRRLRFFTLTWRSSTLVLKTGRRFVFKTGGCPFLIWRRPLISGVRWRRAPLIRRWIRSWGRRRRPNHAGRRRRGCGCRGGRRRRSKGSGRRRRRGRRRCKCERRSRCRCLNDNSRRRHGCKNTLQTQARRSHRLKSHSSNTILRILRCHESQRFLMERQMRFHNRRSTI